MSDTGKQLSAGDWFFGKVLRMGANWKTTLSMMGGVLMAALTWLSTLSYDQGSLAMLIPETWKPTVTKLSGIAALLLLGWNAVAQKSKDVTGGNRQQTLDGDLAKPGEQTLVDLTKEARPAP